jgi:hypothetical protein
LDGSPSAAGRRAGVPGEPPPQDRLREDFDVRFNKRLGIVVALAAALAASALQPLAAAPAGPKITLEKNFPYKGGTDLDFQGDLVYAGVEGAKGGVGIYRVPKMRATDCNAKFTRVDCVDALQETPTKRLGFVQCPGNQNDPLAIRKGLLALAYHSSDCTKHGSGVALFDVRNPKRPRLLDDVALPGGSHTISKYPGKPIIYASPGGLLNGGGVEQILDISNPRSIKVAATYKPNDVGCHDITWYFDKDEKLAFCPGLSGTQIWNVKNPLKPALVSHIANPIQDFHHYALTTKSGDHLIVSDENFEAHDCTTGQSPTGAFYVYDITNRALPVLSGKFSPQRGADPVGGAVTAICTSHQFNRIPGTDIIVSAWYTGGTNIMDFSDPLNPTELDFYQPENANTWSSYWYRGRIYASDLNRGLDVLRVYGLQT